MLKLLNIIICQTLDDHDVLDDYSKALPDSDKFPVLWEDFVKAFKTTGYNDSIQFNTYKGIGHGMPETALFDAVYFFKANNGIKFSSIKAHTNAYSNDYTTDYKKFIKDIKWE